LPRPAHPVSPGLVEVLRIAGHPLARGRVHEGLSQEPRELLGRLPRLGEPCRLHDGDGLRDPLAGEFHGPRVGGIAVAAGEVHLHLPHRVQHVLHAPHGHEKPPPPDDPPPPPVQDDPAAPEYKSGPHNGEHGAEQDDQNGEERPLGALLEWDQPEGDRHDEQARHQEGNAEERQAPAPAAGFEGPRVPVDKRTLAARRGHRPAYHHPTASRLRVRRAGAARCMINRP